jgi:uroporphyrinogen-III synthase
VYNFVALAEAAQVQVPTQVKKVSIGPITTQAIEENGWHVDAQAAKASIEDLVAATVKLFT